MSPAEIAAPRTLDSLDLDILNCLADDCENLEQIYRGVCYEFVSVPGGLPTDHEYRPLPSAPSLWKVVERVRELMNSGLIFPKMNEEGRPWTGGSDPSVLWKAWFDLTATGRAELNNAAAD